MKIALITTSAIPSPKANSIQVMMAAQGLAEQRHALKIWAPGKETLPFNQLKRLYGLHCDPFEIRPLESIPAFRRMDFVLRAVWEAKRWRADLIYTWTIQAAVIASGFGMPVIYEMHDLPGGRFGRRWFSAFAAGKSKKRVAFITHALMERISGEFPALQRSDCVVAPNGFSPQDYENLPDQVAAKREMGFAEGFLASCSGHLYRGRGAELFLALAEAIPEVNFYWFGGDPQEAAQRRDQAEARGIKNVCFTGFIEKSRLPLAQAASDLLLMPYGREIAGSSGGNSAAICSPMKMFEYLASGRPIVSSDLPVLHEVLDESCALFCRPDQPADWISAIQSLIHDPGKMKDLAENAKKRSKGLSWAERQRKIMEGMIEEPHE